MATLADSYTPFDSGAGASNTEAQWRNVFQYARAVGSGRNGVLRGVANSHEVFGDSSGLQVKLRTGEVSIQGHWGQTTAEKTIPVTPNSSGSTRIDRVVARANYTDNTIEFECIAGSSPTTPPTRTQNNSMHEISLATVSVANGAATIASTNVFDARDFVDYPPVYGRLAADQTVNNTTTLVDITGMTVTGTSSGLYAMESYIEYSSATAADLQLQLICSSGVTAAVGGFGVDSTVGATSGSILVGSVAANVSFALGGNGVGTKMSASPIGWVQFAESNGTANTAMVAKWTFAQQSANVSNTVVYKNSWIRLTRVL